MDCLEEEARAVQAIDQVGGEDEVVACKDRFQVAGIALEEFDFGS